MTSASRRFRGRGRIVTLFGRLRTGQIGLVGASKLEAVDFEGHLYFLGGGGSPFVSDAERCGLWRPAVARRS